MKTKCSEIHINTTHLWLMLLSMLRYSMGRRTYITSYCEDLVRLYAKHLLPEQRAQIRKEVRYEMKLAAETGGLLGDQCDHDHWSNIVVFLEEMDK